MSIEESHLAVDLEMVHESRSVRISDVASFDINIINDPSREKSTDINNISEKFNSLYNHRIMLAHNFLLYKVTTCLLKELICLEFNKLQWPNETTVHLLNCIPCVTAHHIGSKQACS